MYEVVVVKWMEMVMVVDFCGIELYEFKFDDGIVRGLGRYFIGDRRILELSVEEFDFVKERFMEFFSVFGSNSVVGMILDDE